MLAVILLGFGVGLARPGKRPASSMQQRKTSYCLVALVLGGSGPMAIDDYLRKKS